MNYNKLILAGNITRDPEIKVVGDGKVAKFGLAVNNGYGDKRKTAFLDCETWIPSLVDVVEKFVKKGSNVLVEGAIHQDNWEKDGQKRSKLFVKVTEIRLGDKKVSDNEESPEPVEVEENTEEIPF